jgi:hypothetical protein
MGAVFTPKDLYRGKRSVLNNAIKDFAPDTKYNVSKVFDSWEGKKSEERLKEILGQDKAESLLKKIRANKNEITENEQEDLQNMFKDSLTFD